VGRKPTKPWFRKQTGWWMCTLGGKQHKLARGKLNKHAAEVKFHELMLTATESPNSPDVRVHSLCDSFLDWAMVHYKQRTYKDCVWFLQRFCESCGDLRVNELKVFHVSEWLRTYPTWGETTRYNARRTVKRVFNWAVSEEHLSKNPLAKLKVGRGRARTARMTIETYRQLNRSVEPPMKILLFALWQTGARPSELCNLQWNQKIGEHIVLDEHKTKKVTDKVRKIPLNEPMRRLLRQLEIKNAESEFVFLNCNGKKWTPNAVQANLRRHAKKLGINDTAYPYSFRHAFATDALEQGLDAVTVAELLGHTSTEMLSRVYAHLSPQHLKAASTTLHRKRKGDN